MADDLGSAPLLDALRQTLGPDHVRTDQAARALVSEDILYRGGLAGAVIAPGSIEELSRAVAIATGAGAPVIARGGGLSYTGGYVAETPGAVVIDCTRLAHIDVDAANSIVTVGAGATWRALHEALKPLGLRTPFWGPLSGIASTIGGGLSQNNALFGAGHYGASVESVTSLAVVLADGRIVRTGSAAQPGASPFFRHYGPDLTGLFLGDSGALGVKAEATFRLIRAPDHEGWASFSFADRQHCAEAMSAIAREGLAADLFGFDPTLARIRMKRASLLADAGALMKVVGAQKSLFDAIKEGAKVALAGRGFLDGADYSLHAVAEGRSKAGVEHDLAEMRRIAAAHGGKEVENTIPKVMRANPWTPLNNVLGPSGERWVPIHGIVRHSDGPAVWAAIDSAFAEMAPEFEAHKIVVGYMITTLSTNGFLLEPVFFWPEARYPLHESIVEPHFLAKLDEFAPNPEGTKVVMEARAKVLEIFTHFGAAHFQVGRTYPYAQTRSPEALALARSVKAHVDPHSLMNPGSLGL